MILMFVFKLNGILIYLICIQRLLFQILEDTYAWLNSWKNCVKNKLISEDEYLTKNTSDGLRVTIRSTRII